MRRARRIAIAVAALATGTPLAAAAANGAPGAPPARLAGSYDLAGRVTAAQNIPGEHVGQVIHRTWTFAPTCADATAGCSTVLLTRPRPRGSDRVLLTRVRTGVYVGSGFFYGPLGCGGRIFRPGERVPFMITVVVAAVSTASGTPTVTRIAGTYVSTHRDNLTRCVALLGHDAARYHGYLLPGS